MIIAKTCSLIELGVDPFRLERLGFNKKKMCYKGVTRSKGNFVKKSFLINRAYEEGLANYQRLQAERISNR